MNPGMLSGPALPPQLVLASNNAHKLQELSSLLHPLGMELVSQGSLGIPEVEEPYATFIENALTKARHAARHSRLPALADDSGLCVDVLGGAPGVHSSRYATLHGHARGDVANNTLLLQQLAGVSDPLQRSARFVCVLVAVRHADDPEPLVATGRWEGRILDAPSGSAGFGYDPLMFIPALDASVAELAPEIKNRHSHRAQAMNMLLAQMRELWPARAVA